MIQPTNGHVLVMRGDLPQSHDRIVIPESAKEPPTEGRVLAIGPGLRSRDGTRPPSDLSVGDWVIFDKYGVHEVQHEGREALLIHEETVLCVTESHDRTNY